MKLSGIETNCAGNVEEKKGYPAKKTKSLSYFSIKL
jgi:hypothetical protein